MNQNVLLMSMLQQKSNTFKSFITDIYLISYLMMGNIYSPIPSDILGYYSYASFQIPGSISSALI